MSAAGGQDRAAEAFSRTAMLLGDDGVAALGRSRVAVFGLGGVGGHAAEALVRSGLGAIDLIDADTVAPSNLNRQIIALRSTLGKLKTDAMAERLLDINPALRIVKHPIFYLPENADCIDLAAFDYVVDAVDTVAAKLEIIGRCVRAGTPVISAMGAGNKLDPTRLQAADITQTSVCPLARVMRREARRRGIEHFRVVYSTEPALTPGDENGRRIPGSTSFVPSVMGLIIAGEVVRCLAAGGQP